MEEEAIYTQLETEQEKMTTLSSGSVQKVCPKCGKSFKPSGLAGHLRFVHKVKSDTASELTKNAPRDNVSKIDKIFEVYERVNRVRQRMDFVKAHRTDKEKLFSTDEASDEAMEALKEEESRLTDELRVLQGKTETRDFFGTKGWTKNKEQKGTRK